MLFTFRKLLRAIAAILLVPVLLFEEWGWDLLQSGMAQLAKLSLWARFEAAVRRLPPWAALLAFFVPMLCLVPLKLFALFLLARGHAASAFLLIVAAKVIGTAVVARLFHLIEPALMRIPIFARWYPRWVAWKDGILAIVRRSAPWRAGHAAMQGLKRRWRGWWRRPT